MIVGREVVGANWRNWPCLDRARPERVSRPSSVPGSGSHSRAASVEGDMCGVGGEPGQDTIWIPVRKRVDLHRVVGACRHQLAVLWREEHISVHHWQLPCWFITRAPSRPQSYSWRWPTLSAREYTFSPTVMNFGSSSSRPSHIRTSPSLPQVTKNLRKSVSSWSNFGVMVQVTNWLFWV